MPSSSYLNYAAFQSMGGGGWQRNWMCVSRVPANSHVVGIGLSGTFNTMQDVG